MTLTASAAYRLLCADGLDSVLIPVGFSRGAGQAAWIRPGGDINHVIAVIRRRKFHDIQWGITSDGASEIIWGTPSNTADVSQAVISGTPSSIRHPAPGQSWTLQPGMEKSEVEMIAAAVRDAATVVATRLVDFVDRKSVCDYLLENRDPIDHRDFVIPTNLPLKLLTAATLAVLDRDMRACELLSDVDTAMAPYADELSRGRLSRLHAASAGLCA